MKKITASLFLALTTALGAVEIGPVPLVSVHDGDTIAVTLDGKEQKVRLLYIDTPETSDNDHGAKMPEGPLATAALTEALATKIVYLWGPEDTLKPDRYGRLLAVVYPTYSAPGVKIGPQGTEKTTTFFKTDESAELLMIMGGHSVYWRKYGNAPAPLHEMLLKAQTDAESNKAGSWTTAPQWMKDKSNETTAPKAKE